MRKYILRYKRKCIQTIFTIKCVLVLCIAHADTHIDTFAMYVAPNGVMYVNGNAQMSVMSNVINSGTFGSVKGITINMLGDLWRNTSGASFPDETGVNSFTGVGGNFRFSGSSVTQTISGGFSVKAKSGPSFPNLILANPQGVVLDEKTDAQVRGIFHFENGLLYLNGNNFVVGAADPGTITGYSDTRFIATGNSTSGGSLYRSKVSASSGNIIFPVGTQLGSYAPVSVMFNTTSPQDLHVRVFDDIYSRAVSGTKASTASLQQTWNMGQEDNSNVPSVIALQHTVGREGAAFTAHRGNSYISRFDPAVQTWDTLPPSGVISPGSLTTGTPLNNTFINTRSLVSIGQVLYLTKTADKLSDSLTLSKAALTPVRQADGSFLVTYMFLLRNQGILGANTLQVFDSLNHVFSDPATFSVSSVTASGKLVADNNYDGVTVTNLLLPASTLAGHTTDTILLVVHVVPNVRDGYYYNKASLVGVLTGANNTLYHFNNQSVDGLTPPVPGATPVPTPVALSATKYLMPEGFSPNGDGVNDKLVIGNLNNSLASVRIYNKQGIMVYKNLAYKNDWDGTYNQNFGGAVTRQVEEGTYFYNIQVTDPATGKTETYYGYISIWR